MDRRGRLALSLMLLSCTALAAQQFEPVHVAGKGWRVDVPNGLTFLSSRQLAEIDRRAAQRARERGDSARDSSTMLLFATGADGETPFISLTYIAVAATRPTAFGCMTRADANALACNDPRTYQFGVTACDSGLIIQASGRAAHLSVFRRRIDGEDVRSWNLMVPTTGAYYKLTITMTEQQAQRTPAQPIWESLVLDE